MSFYEDVLSLILFGIWAVVLWIIMIGKIVKSGLSNYSIHLTNWGWTLSLLLFTLDILSRFDTRKVTKEKPLRTDSMITVVLFWTTSGTCWLIFWMFLLIVNNNPNILESEFIKNGGEYQDGFVFVMNTVFHVIPAIMTLLYAFLRRDPIMRSIKFFTSKRIGKLISVCFCLLEIFFLPGFIVLMYFLDTNAHMIYDTTIPNIVLIFVGIGILLFTNGLIFGAFYFQKKNK